MRTKRVKSPFRVGAVVRVVRPLFVLRVGYPMDLHDEAQRILADRRGRERIRFLLERFGVEPHDVRYAGPHGTMDVRAVEKIAYAVAGQLCQQKRWGGRQRTIHTAEVPEAAGKEYRVRDVRFVKTGTYDPGGRQNSEEDFDPPGLYGEKTHRLLTLDYGGQLPEAVWNRPGGRYAAEVEAVNCELVQEAGDGES